MVPLRLSRGRRRPTAWRPRPAVRQRVAQGRVRQIALRSKKSRTPGCQHWLIIGGETLHYAREVSGVEEEINNLLCLTTKGQLTHRYLTCAQCFRECIKECITKCNA